jgi:hypothetical protein
MQKKKTKKTDPISNPNSFVPILDMKASFFVAENKDEEKIVLRLDEGQYEGTIVELSNFNFDDDDASVLTLNYSIIYTPTGELPKEKEFHAVIKPLIGKIVEHAIRTAIAIENDNLISMKK